MVRRWRNAHDPQAAVIGAHFTFVFGRKTRPSSVCEQVERVAASHAPIHFLCDQVIARPITSVRAGREARVSYAFLVPGRAHGNGSDEFVRLYRDLNIGAIQNHEFAQSHPFVPHITVATTPVHQEAQNLATAWSAELANGRASVEGSIRGVVDALTVGIVADGRFSPLAVTPLANSLGPT